MQQNPSENNPFRLFVKDLDLMWTQTELLWRQHANTNILLTGGTGFFGKWLVSAFLWAHHLSDKMLGVKLNARMTILTRNPSRVPRHPALSTLVGDIGSVKFPDEPFTDMIHAASRADRDPRLESPQELYRTIVTGTERLMDFAVSRRPDRFLYVSSGAVVDPLKKDEVYAQCKYKAEQIVLKANQEKGLHSMIARCYAFTGAYLNLEGHFAVGNFIRNGLRNEPIVIHGDGTPIRSYLYAADLVVWLYSCLFMGRAESIYDVGSDQTVSIEELAIEVASVFEKSGTPVSVLKLKAPQQGSLPQRYVPNTIRTKEELKLAETLSWKEGVERMVRWYQENSPYNTCTKERDPE